MTNDLLIFARAEYRAIINASCDKPFPGHNCDQRSLTTKLFFSHFYIYFPLDVCYCAENFNDFSNLSHTDVRYFNCKQRL